MTLTHTFTFIVCFSLDCFNGTHRPKKGVECLHRYAVELDVFMMEMFSFVMLFYFPITPTQC